VCVCAEAVIHASSANLLYVHFASGLQYSVYYLQQIKVLETASCKLPPCSTGALA